MKEARLQSQSAALKSATNLGRLDVAFICACGPGNAPAGLAFEIEFLHQLHGQFFDRARGGVEPFNAFAPHHLFRCRDFVATVLQRSIFAVRAALGADALLLFRIDCQPIQLAAKGLQSRRQLIALEIFRDQRVVGRLQ